jgi:hypothetical protein
MAESRGTLAIAVPIGWAASAARLPSPSGGKRSHAGPVGPAASVVGGGAVEIGAVEIGSGEVVAAVAAVVAVATGGAGEPESSSLHAPAGVSATITAAVRRVRLVGTAPLQPNRPSPDAHPAVTLVRWTSPRWFR